MKKHHIKAIKSQAQYLRKIVKDIKSMKRSKKLIGGENLIYTRKERHRVNEHNGKHYRPTNIKSAIAGMSVHQLARLMRIVYTDDSVSCRTGRIYGNHFDEKNVLCKELFM